ncbi:prepilin-type N-terminal cleavage/methylation domain-containing protein [Candidatus Aerophobetes bacterium]|nr:prepilin-type N-terminal cleavage/methylation domain-containing protein [Candidatus Aerophobetes bacterium]
MAFRKAAFTLPEVLIATFILSFLILGLYFIFDKSHSAWEKGDVRLEQYQKIRGCLETMTKELKATFINPADSSLVFKGKKEDVLFFCSTNLPHEKGEYDLKKVNYQLANSKLIRKVKSNLSSPLTPSATTILASEIDELTFSYYDGKKWHPEWDSEKNKGFSSLLPKAVAIELAVRGKGESPLTFSTTVSIPVE